MYEIETQEMTDEFFSCWKAAANHLNNQVDHGIQSWLRAHPNPPFLEHLSFRLGNQLFFVRVEDVNGNINGPGNFHGLLAVAKMANGLACILPMRKKLYSNAWVTDMPGWGLVDAETNNAVDPVALVSDEKILMTSWEIHDLAVQVVRDYLDEQGFQLMSWQGNPKVDPSIWFVGNTKEPEWVVVRSSKFPPSKVGRPSNWVEISENCSKISATGHFAAVVVSSMNQPLQSNDESPLPLWRGYGVYVNFEGLK